MSSEKRPDLNRKLNSQDLRRWYWTREELVALARMLKVPVSGGKEALTGSGFRFDEPMRTFIHEGAGKTLGAAIECWYATRKTANQQKEIAPQFEYNRFIRHWHQQHPSSSRQEALVAWKEYRSKPVERREE